MSLLSLKEWIAGLRGEIHQAMAAAPPYKAHSFRLTELSLEVHVVAKKETTGKGSAQFWVVSGEAGHNVAKETAHKVCLKLQPGDDYWLGDDDDV